MTTLSTRGAAKKLGISYGTLANYVKVGKLPLPNTALHGSRAVHLWTEEEIEHVRKLLPKIANGRKTRYKKKQSALSNRQSAKAKAQPKAAVPHKSRKPGKKK
jgi:predicted site-specific integrase-resolvase